MLPLPTSAQFLNVIESVFSGMARAVLHNSDYATLDDAKAAVTRYLDERNEAFLRERSAPDGRSGERARLKRLQRNEQLQGPSPAWASITAHSLSDQRAAMNTT